ncbi:glycosyltransferase family 2 protein [Moheibacter sp.]|uniref:glycosyltransferase family 2 protein n=1 Tax=Moheibacter sp. TaxID=1965316 RepID=UPI003C74AAB8
MNKLSILIAAYNVEAFIEKCVLSCYDDSLSDLYEIIVVNDGSTDSTANVLDKLKNSVKNLHVVYQENSGLGIARNTGIKNAKGEYLWMIDGDDYATNNAVKLILDKISSKEDIYGFNFNIITENNKVIKKYKSNFIKEKQTASEYYLNHYEDSYTFQYIFKKNLFIDNDIFFQSRINMQDSEILPKIVFRAKNLVYTDECIYNYVQHKNSYTNTSNADKRLNYFKSIIAVENSLLSFGELIREKDSILFEGIQKKRNSLHKIVFNHLIFFSYSKAGLIKIINYLKENKFYPLKHNAKGKFLWIKYGLNNFPVFTKRVIDYYLKQ